MTRATEMIFARGDVVEVNLDGIRPGIVLRQGRHTDPITYEVLVGTRKWWMTMEEGKMVTTFSAWYKRVDITCI